MHHVCISSANVFKYLLYAIASVFHLYASEASGLMSLLQHKIPSPASRLVASPCWRQQGGTLRSLDSPCLVFITPVNGFIRTTAINLLDFQRKPIRGDAGGEITTEGMTEDSHCFCHPSLCDLVKFRQAPQVSVCQNNSVSPLVIAGARELWTLV